MFRGGFQLAHWTDPSMENLSESTLTLISLELGRGRQKRGHLAPRSLTLALTAAQPPDLNITSQICFYQMLPLTQPVIYCKEKYWFSINSSSRHDWRQTSINLGGQCKRLKSTSRILDLCLDVGSDLGSDVSSYVGSDHLGHLGISFLTSSNHQLFRNIAFVGYLWHFVISCICVFVYLTVGNIRFNVLGPWAFQKYSIIRFYKVFWEWWRRRQTTGWT